MELKIAPLDKSEMPHYALTNGSRVMGRIFSEAEANEIVTACNAHDALLAENAELKRLTESVGILVAIQACEEGNDRESSHWFDIHASSEQMYRDEGYRIRRLYDHAVLLPTIADAELTRLAKALVDAEAVRTGLVGALEELVVLVDAHLEGEYKFDSFSLQPAHTALAAAKVTP